MLLVCGMTPAGRFPGCLLYTSPIDMLGEIQSKYKVGERISLVVSVSEIHNERLGTSRRNYMVKTVSYTHLDVYKRQPHQVNHHHQRRQSTGGELCKVGVTGYSNPALPKKPSHSPP